MIRKLFNRVCYKVYRTGEAEAKRLFLESLYRRVESEDGKCFDEGAQVVNLANDRSRIKIGAECRIYGNLTVYPHEGEISFGKFSSLGNGSRIVAGAKISIGERVMIAHNVNILDNNSHPLDARLRHQDFIETFSIGMQNHDLSAQDIIIEDDVWIGFNSIILKGVRIGQGAIVGAGSVVTKDVEAWTINVGNPLRVVKNNNMPTKFDD